MYISPYQLKLRLLGSNQETSETVTFELMYQEIASICKKQNISKFQVKKEVKKYCFELPDIPREAEYLRLRYNYTGIIT